MEVYRSTTIYVRGGKRDYLAEYAWQNSASCRHYAAHGVTEEISIQKAKKVIDAIDAEIAEQALISWWFRTALV